MNTSFQESNIEAFSEQRNSNSPRTESFLKTPISANSNLNSTTHTRFNSEVEYPLKDLLKKMQDELDFLRQENTELKSRGTSTVMIYVI